jgi:hypothetical protein
VNRRNSIVVNGKTCPFANSTRSVNTDNASFGLNPEYARCSRRETDFYIHRHGCSFRRPFGTQDIGAPCAHVTGESDTVAAYTFLIDPTEFHAGPQIEAHRQTLVSSSGALSPRNSSSSELFNFRGRFEFVLHFSSGFVTYDANEVRTSVRTSLRNRSPLKGLVDCLNLTFCSDDFRVQGRPLRIAPLSLCIFLPRDICPLVDGYKSH